jgi:hypothetical protein
MLAYFFTVRCGRAAAGVRGHTRMRASGRAGGRVRAGAGGGHHRVVLAGLLVLVLEPAQVRANLLGDGRRVWRGQRAELVHLIGGAWAMAGGRADARERARAGRASTITICTSSPCCRKFSSAHATACSLHAVVSKRPRVMNAAKAGGRAAVAPVHGVIERQHHATSGSHFLSVSVTGLEL